MYVDWYHQNLSGKEVCTMIYWQLFLSFIQIGALSFGGGYAAIPLIQNQGVDIHHWLSVGEFNDLVTISQMTPGPIAINSATFVGEKIGGLWGAVIATIGCILPSLIIVTLIAYFYMKYRHLESLQSVLNVLRPAVVAMIASAGISIIVTAVFGEQAIIAWTHLKVNMLVIFIICLFLLLKYKMSPIAVMLIGGLCEVFYQFLL